MPEYTANADAIGALRILESIKFHGFEKKTKFYQAGTSEMFGKVKEIPQKRKNTFLSKKSLWRCQSLCTLDYSKL